MSVSYNPAAAGDRSERLVFVAVAIEMWFSEEGDRRVRRLWLALEARGVKSLGTATHRKHVPHVSLTVMDRLPTQEDALTDAVRPALGKTLRLSAVGGFPGVATFLLPAHHQRPRDHERLTVRPISRPAQGAIRSFEPPPV